MKFSSIALIAAVAGVAEGFAPTSRSADCTSALSMSLEKYSDELKATAAAMVKEGKGLLACDESTGTVGARLESIGLENNEDNRREVRFFPDVFADLTFKNYRQNSNLRINSLLPTPSLV